MLQAQNGRQLNLAADVVRKFLTSKQVDIKQSEALQLVSQLIGYPNYHAARAGMQGVAKGVASGTSSWRQLAHAIGTLSDEQLDMDVQVSEGCDENGNATFSKAFELLVASADSIAAGAHIFADNQPILIIEEFDSSTSDADGPGFDAEDEYRVGMQLECATDEPASLANWHIARDGLDEAIEYLNSEYGCNISLGDFVVYSEAEQGFWNTDFGWVSDKASATGVMTMPNVLSFPDDAELVRYVDAVDVEEADEDKPNVMVDKVQGAPVSRYSWPARFEAIWSDVRGDAVGICTDAVQLLKAKGFQAEVSERVHGDNAGHELVMSMRKDGIYGGEMVLALADFHASGGLLPCAAGMNWFFKPPARDTLFGSILPQNSGEKPLSTESEYFKRLVALVDAKQLAEFMVKMFEPEQVSK